MADTPQQKEQQQFTDQDLVAQTLVNKQAFAAIVRRYEAPLLRYINRLGCRDTAAAQDLLQEIFIKTYVHLNDYDHSLQFSSWIYRIAHNEIISSFRKEKNGPGVLEREGDLFLFEKVVDDLDLTDQDGQKHSSAEIQAAVDRLDPRSREIIVLKFFEEKRYEEISDILQIPEGTVATMINRAKKKIKNYLEES
ncbi:MAG: sigma-70 family RNA polymerase sigma factor [Chlorobiaceae bacterium]